jgi:capsular exopolysaccharide synthesis family protein
VRTSLSNARAWVRGLFTPGAPGQQSGTPDESEIQARRIDAFLAGLTITPVRRSRIVDVVYRSTDPRLAARIANGLAREYMEQSLEFKFTASKEATAWLEARLAEQRTSVEASESQLQKYREENDAVSLADRQNIVVQKLADLNAAVTRAKTVRIEKEALHEQVSALAGDRAALEAFHLVQANELVVKLKTDLALLQQQESELSRKLGDRHPDLIKLRASADTLRANIHAEIDKVVQGVRSEYVASVAQEQALSQALEAQKREALALDRIAIEYRSIERDSASNRQMYDSLLQRTKETGITGALKTSNVRIVDEAEVPREPVGTGLLRTVGIGFGASLVLGLGMAFLLERLDNRIKSPDEIATHFDLPLLGMLPAIPPRKFFTRVPMVDDGLPPTFVEAFRVIRTNVMFASAADGPRVVIVTSTAPNEGKTMVATNLAVSLAMAGQRVVLIDGDMRRPTAHGIFDRPLEPGLSNLLVGTAEARDVVRQATPSTLYVVTAGHVPPNPADLLVSERFKQFVQQLRTRADWIVIDTPPVMAVVDASIMAHLASGVVFVVGSEMTSRQAITTSLEQLSRTGATFFGMVLNRIDVERNGYYYSPYYSKEYRSYYDGEAPRAAAGDLRVAPRG